jgi:hypothetical protein
VSRYERVTLAPQTREELEAGLSALGLVPTWADPAVGLMLAGSLECAGEPVDLRLPAGTLGSVEDFGFLLADGALALVCGELDRSLLERRLVSPLVAAVAVSRARRFALDAGLELEEQLEVDGTRRLRLTPVTPPRRPR